jgi:hypothetical protein
MDILRGRLWNGIHFRDCIYNQRQNVRVLYQKMEYHYLSTFKYHVNCPSSTAGNCQRIKQTIIVMKIDTKSEHLDTTKCILSQDLAHIASATTSREYFESQSCKFLRVSVEILDQDIPIFA